MLGSLAMDVDIASLAAKAKRSVAEILVRRSLASKKQAAEIYSHFLNESKWQERVSPGNLASAWGDYLNRFEIKQSVSVCLQIPYGDKKCDFCNCPVKVRKDSYAKIDFYYSDMAKEIDFYAPLIKSHSVESLAFRGLPSLFSKDQFKSCIVKISSSFKLNKQGRHFVEFQVDDRDLGSKLALALEYGFNLASFRTQPLRSAQDAQAVNAAILAAYHAGFKYVNVDLVFGLVGGSAKPVLDNIGKIVTASPTTISMHRLTFMDMLKNKSIGGGQSAFESLVRKSDEEKMIESFSRFGYGVVPWAPLQRRWTIYRRDVPNAIMENVKHLVPLEGGQTAFMGLGQFARSVIGESTYERYLFRPFEPGRGLYRMRKSITKQRMALYIISALEAYSSLEFESFKSYFGVDIRDYFLPELRVLEHMEKIQMNEKEFLFCPINERERVFYSLFFILEPVSQLLPAQNP